MSAKSFNWVAGYHLNPATCGVAKFNQIIADHYGVPHGSLFDVDTKKTEPVFLSIKVSEMSEKDFERFEKWSFALPESFRFYLFLHDFSDTTSEIHLIKKSLKTLCGNVELVKRLKAIAHDKIQLMWSPGTLKIDWPEQEIKPEVSIFTFGMAHKLRASYYHKIRDLFDKAGVNYQLYISTAIHEGTSMENMLESSFVDLKQIFGNRVKYLGYLSDFALHQYLLQADFLVAFFQKGIRANNSSVNTALEMGLPVITNLDESSPEYLKHGDNILDIDKLTSIPMDACVRLEISKNAKKISENLSWKSFFKELGQYE